MIYLRAGFIGMASLTLWACSSMMPTGVSIAGGHKHCDGRDTKCEVKVWVSKSSDMKCLIESKGKVTVGRPEHGAGPIPSHKTVHIIWVIEKTGHEDRKMFRFAANGVYASPSAVANEFVIDGNDDGEGAAHTARRFRWKSEHPVTPSKNGAKYTINVQMQAGGDWSNPPVNCVLDPVITNLTETLK